MCTLSVALIIQSYCKMWTPDSVHDLSMKALQGTNLSADWYHNDRASIEGIISVHICSRDSWTCLIICQCLVACFKGSGWPADGAHLNFTQNTISDKKRLETCWHCTAACLHTRVLALVKGTLSKCHTILEDSGLRTEVFLKLDARKDLYAFQPPV